MQPNIALNRYSLAFFLCFLALVIWGFWNTYYSNPLQIPDLLRQLHALCMTAWCALLIAQAYLVRTNRRALHRAIGKASYVLVPINVILQIAVLQNRVSQRPQLFDHGVLLPRGLTQAALTLGAAVLFGLLYALAMSNRRTPPVHARYMICTVLPILSPATDRIIGQHVPAITHWLPRAADRPFAPFLAWVIGDSLLIALAIWDWKSGRRYGVFPVVLLLAIGYQAFTLTAYRVGAWRLFCAWFLAPQF